MAGEIKLNSVNFASESGGTITVNNGTLGSGLVFPAGHVIQVVNPAVSVETNSLTTSYVNYYEVSLTLKSSSSKVFIVHSFNYYISSGGFGQQIYRSTSTPVTTSDTVVFNFGSADGTGPTQYFSSSVLYSTVTTQAVDDISGQTAGDQLYYGFFYRKYSSGGTVDLPVNGAPDGFFATTLFEIQK
jgi:hypothetical protein